MIHIGLDIGDVRVGVAKSDVLGMIASPFETYRRVGYLKDVEYLASLAEREGAGVIVCGLPLGLSGDDTEQTAKVREFASEIAKRFSGELTFVDERFTTVIANDALILGGVSRENRKKYVDKVAASLILQSYLDAKR